MHPYAAPVRTLLLVASLAASGCDLPTELPLWETEWDAVVVSDTVRTADLLPEQMSVVPDGFLLERFTSESEVTLEEVCALCTCFEGPIPPLAIAEHDWPLELPPGLVSARLRRGTADVVIHNEVGFDVLDDGEGLRGFLLVELTDRFTGEVSESVRVDGSFPARDSLRLSFDLTGLELSNRLVARVSGETPGSGCDDVELGPESGFRTRVTLRGILADSVRVIVSDADLSFPDREYELPGWLVDRLRPGDAELTLDVEVDTGLPTDFELELSAAASATDLFTGRAALFTPVVLPSGDPEPRFVRESFLLDLGALRDAEHLFVASKSRILGSRIVLLDGGESVGYAARLRARIPTR